MLVLKNGIMLTITSVLVGIINMFFSAFIARKIGSEAMGIFSLIMSVFTFAMTLAISGVNLATTRLVAEEMAFGRTKSAHKALGLCIAYSLFFSILACILLILSAGLIGNNFLHQQLVIIPLKILAISLPFASLSSVFSGYFAAMQKGGRASTSVLFDSLARVFIVTHLVSVVFAGQGVEKMIIAIILGSTIAEMLGCLYRFACYKFGKKEKNNSVKNREDNSLFKRLLHIAIPVALASYLKSALSTTKQTLVPINLVRFGMVTSVALSQYGIIQGMVLPLLFFPMCFLFAFSQLLVPEVSALAAREYSKRIKQVISKIFKTTMIFSIFCSVIFIAYAQPLSEWIFKRPDIAPMVRIFALCMPITYFDVIVDSLLKGLDKQVAVVNINIIDSVVTIGMILTLIPNFGIAGYIAVFFISETFNAILSIGKLLKTIACPFDFLNWLVKPLAAAIIALLVSHNLVLFIIAYFATLILTKSLTKEDLKI